MGVGRKKQTFYGGAILPVSPNPKLNSGCGRNLGKYELGGVIFGCKNSTMKECRSKQLFGLPARHFSYVRNITPGLPLFLFNYSDRKLHGIFEATSKGKMCIDPFAWTNDFSEMTPYPAQVKIRVRLQCHPLVEEKFGQVMANNYYRNEHFWFELDHRQTSKLMFLLTSLAIAPGTPVPRYNMKWRNVSPGTPVPRRNMKCRNVSPSLPSRDLKKGEAFEADEPDIKHFTRRTNFGYIASIDEGIESLETQSVAREVKEDEKNLIYMKLKELALEWENQYHSLHDNVNDTIDVNSMCSSEKSYLEISAGLEEEEEECYNLPFVDQCPIAQVDEAIQDVEELTTFKKIQTHKNCYLEQNLMKSAMEIQYLKDRFAIIETAFKTQKKVIHPSAELYLDHKESLLLKGASEGESQLSATNLFSPSQNVIKFVKSMSSVHSNALLVLHSNGELYVFGGENGCVWYATAKLYSPVLKEWTLWTSLNQKKEPLARISLNNNIFSIGANYGVDCLSNVDMLDSGRGVSLPSILDKSFDLVAVESHGSLYATGRYNGINYLKFALDGFDGCTIFSSIKVVDPSHGAWTIVEPMNHLREYSAAPVAKESIYVIEGDKGVDDIVDKF